MVCQQLCVYKYLVGVVQQRQNIQRQVLHPTLEGEAESLRAFFCDGEDIPAQVFGFGDDGKL